MNNIRDAYECLVLSNFVCNVAALIHTFPILSFVCWIVGWFISFGCPLCMWYSGAGGAGLFFCWILLFIFSLFALVFHSISIAHLLAWPYLLKFCVFLTACHHFVIRKSCISSLSHFASHSWTVVITSYRILCMLLCFICVCVCLRPNGFCPLSLLLLFNSFCIVYRCCELYLGENQVLFSLFKP